MDYLIPRCPKGHVRLTEEERVGIVGAMEERRQKLIDETNRMSVSEKTGTLFCSINSLCPESYKSRAPIQ